MKWLKKYKKILLPVLTVLVLLTAVLISVQNIPGGSGPDGLLKTGTSAVQEPLTKARIFAEPVARPSGRPVKGHSWPFLN